MENAEVWKRAIVDKKRYFQNKKQFKLSPKQIDSIMSLRRGKTESDETREICLPERVMHYHPAIRQILFFPFYEE